MNNTNNTNNTNKTLVLDFDGVILDNPIASNIIIDNINNFVEIKLKNIPHKPIDINKDFFYTFGHTLLGLDAFFNIKVPLKEFNDFIYDDNTFKQVANIYENNNLNRVSQVKQLVDKYNYDVYIFSNASYKWIDFNLELLNLKNYFTHDKIITCDNHLINNNLIIKLQKKSYYIVEQIINNKNITFVEDNIVNLIEAPTYWDKYLISSNNNNNNHPDIKCINNLLYI